MRCNIVRARVPLPGVSVAPKRRRISWRKSTLLGMKRRSNPRNQLTLNSLYFYTCKIKNAVCAKTCSTSSKKDAVTAVNTTPPSVLSKPPPAKEKKGRSSTPPPPRSAPAQRSSYPPRPELASFFQKTAAHEQRAPHPHPRSTQRSARPGSIVRCQPPTPPKS
jgi:hypothetical protein